MADAIRVGLGTAAQIRAAMLGNTSDGIHVVRQAWRITEHDSDELALLSVGDRSWWVAQRLSDQLSVWAFAGEDEADAGFERIMAAGGTWREAGAAKLAG